MRQSGYSHRPIQLLQAQQVGSEWVPRPTWRKNSGDKQPMPLQGCNFCRKNFPVQKSAWSCCSRRYSHRCPDDRQPGFPTPVQGRSKDWPTGATDCAGTLPDNTSWQNAILKGIAVWSGKQKFTPCNCCGKFIMPRNQILTQLVLVRTSMDLCSRFFVLP